jgi:hypothetical protein
MSEGHTYTVPMANQTIVADATLVIIHTASAITTRGSRVEVMRCWANQIGTELSDQLGIIIAQKATAFGTYTSTTPVSHEIGGTASGIAGGTAGAAATSGTDASAEGAGTVTTIIEEGFNNLNGYLWVPTPEERIVLNADTAVILKIVGTPATLTGWCAGITFRELN